MPARDLHLPENWQKAPGGANPDVKYSCLLTSVPSGGKLTWEFSPDPTVALWPLSMSTTPLPTRGGQVVYPGYRGIGPLLISGALRSRYDKFQLASFVTDHHHEAIHDGKPLHFIYPERDWDFAVYISALPDVGLNGQEGEMTSYILQADITRDHTTLDEVPLSDFGIPEGIQWVPIEEAARIAAARFPGSEGVEPVPEGASERAPGGSVEGPAGSGDTPSGARASGPPTPFSRTRGPGSGGRPSSNARAITLPLLPGESAPSERNTSRLRRGISARVRAL